MGRVQHALGISTVLLSLLVAHACAGGADVRPRAPRDFDCGVRRLALRYAAAVLNGQGGSRGQSDVYDALQLGPGCGDAPPPSSPHASLGEAAAARAKTRHATAIKAPASATAVLRGGRRLDPRASPGGPSPPQGDHYYVDCGAGDDSSSGASPKDAWATLHRAAAALAARDAEATRVPTTIHVGAGTCYVGANGTLALGPEHSGGGPEAPVVWLADVSFGNGSSVTLSGGVPLNGLDWQPKRARGPQGVDGGGAAVYEAKLPADMATMLSSLPRGLETMWSVAPQVSRQVRARWPNGDPAHFCARDNHGGDCPGYAQASASRVTHGHGSASALAPNNVKVRSATSGAVIATGLMRPFNQSFNFTLPTRTAAWDQPPRTWSAFAAKTGSAVSRFNATYNAPFWGADVPNNFYVRSAQLRNASPTWAPPTTPSPASKPVAFVYQTGYWGNWAAYVKDVDRHDLRIDLEDGGLNQEQRGGTIGGSGTRGIAQDYFLENLVEELDAEQEFFVDYKTGTLSWAPPNGTAPPAGANGLVAPVLDSIVSLRGSWSPPASSASRSTPDRISDVQFRGFTFSHAARTFLSDYEPTAGGDWSIHRGAAVHVQDATRVAIDDCVFQHNDGNGVILSLHVSNSSVTNSDFVDTGDSPVVLFGATDLFDGRAPTQPVQNEVSHNHFWRWGVWGRQTSAVFTGLAHHNNISYNVLHDGPRAGYNINSGLGGGTLFEGSLLFNVVQDTGEHGSFNSWDRQPLLWATLDTNETRIVPDLNVVRQNFVFRNSFRGPTSNLFCLDKDDGSSAYLEDSNVLVYGSTKDRDGIERIATGNLILYADAMANDTTHSSEAVALQVNGFAHDTVVNNTIVSATGTVYGLCASFNVKNSDNLPLIQNNTLVTPGLASTPFSNGGCGGVKVQSLAAWQRYGLDVGSQQVWDVQTSDVLGWVQRWLPLRLQGDPLSDEV